MGVISRQGFKYSLIGYFGFLIGTLSSIFIYPFDYEYYGKLRYLMSMAELLFPFILIGISYSNVRFYQELKIQNKHHNLLSFSFIFTGVFTVIFLIVLLFYSQFFPQITKLKFWEYKYSIFILMLILAFTQIISKYLTNLKRIAIPGLLENIIPKFGILTAFILYVFFSLNNFYSIFIFLSFFFISFLGLFFYLKKLDKFSFSWNYSFLKENNLYKTILNYGFFSLLGSVGSMLALRIDGMMIVEFIDEKSNGIYATLLSILTILTIPTIGIYSISNPLIREYILKNQTQELNKLHQKTSFILLLIGSLLFCLMISSMDSLFLLMKNGNELLKNSSIVYILGFATLIDLSTGFNSHIISMSKYYRYNVYFMIFLSILTILLNLIFIKFFNFGIQGIAFATAISLSLYNIIKIIFNWIKFKVHPFNKNIYQIIILLITCITINLYIPKLKNIWINLVLNPIIIFIIFLIGNYFFNFIYFKSIKNMNIKKFLTGK